MFGLNLFRRPKRQIEGPVSSDILREDDDELEEMIGLFLEIGIEVRAGRIKPSAVSSVLRELQAGRHSVASRALSFDPGRLRLYPLNRQTDGDHVIRILNGRMLDDAAVSCLLANPECIPDSWQSHERIYLTGTSDSGFVRGVRWKDGGLWRGQWVELKTLSHNWCRGSVALLEDR